jgi:flagellar basal body-associated protein FliL
MLKAVLMSDRTKQIIIVMYAAFSGMAILGGVAVYLYLLATGSAAVPETVQGAFWLVILNVLGILAPFVANIIRDFQSRSKFAQLENKLQNGLGDRVAQKVADQVSDRLPTMALDVQPGGQRRTDPPADPAADRLMDEIARTPQDEPSDG